MHERGSINERVRDNERVREEVGDVPAIDGLRGLAVLWVVAFHYTVVREASLSADPWISALRRVPVLDTLVRNGYLGVDLFFLISGFLLVLPWLVHARAGLAPPSALRFYARRIRRIVPAYYVQLFLLFTVALPLLGGIRYWRSDLYVDLWNGIAHGLFLQDTSPLTSGSLQVNGALWTLPVEVQFYALLPLAAPLFIRAPRTMLAVAIATSLAWQWAGAHDLRPLVDMELRLGSHWRWSEAVVRDVIAMQLPAYLAHFALGILLGRMWLASRDAIASSATKVLRWSAVIAALALLAASLEGMLPVPHEHQRMIPALAIAVLLFAAVSSGSAIVHSLLGRGALAFAGRVSYSAYLYHLPVLLIWGIHPSIFAGWLSLPGYIAVILCVSWMSWRWIEQPFLRARKPRVAPPPLAALPLSAEDGRPSPATGSPR